jgi:hypothetical protein
MSQASAGSMHCGKRSIKPYPVGRDHRLIPKCFRQNRAISSTIGADLGSVHSALSGPKRKALGNAQGSIHIALIKTSLQGRNKV